MAFQSSNMMDCINYFAASSLLVKVLCFHRKDRSLRHLSNICKDFCGPELVNLGVAMTSSRKRYLSNPLK